MTKEYDVNNQLDAWLKGIYDEISFWSKYIGEEGYIYKTKWKITTDPNRKFSLEEDIPKNMYGRDYNFVDVGSGPFSRCGFITDKVNLNHCAVDPLADVYKYLTKRNHVGNGINLRTGFVELLDKEFEPNKFDLVHMSNSLDHSFDALLGVYQLLNICKIGGKVILRHKQNEAITGRYEGLHQWNLNVDVENNIFTIWRADDKYDVTKLMSEYAEIKCSKDPIEDIFYRVEFIKKRDVVVPQNKIYDMLLYKIYSYMLSIIVNDVYKGVNSPKTIFIEQQTEGLNEIPEKKLINIFNTNGWCKVAIYGMGALGTKLYDVLDKAEIKIERLIDERSIEYRGNRTVRLAEIKEWNNIDLVIVTTFSGFDQIKKNIDESNYKGNVISIEAITNL